jgi:amino acid adenylation domain-containing protein
VLFHVAWAQVLAQCTGRNDMVFGTVLLGRLQGSAGADQALGMFINTLPIRISLANTSVRQAVNDTYQRLTEILNHEQASLALAQRCSAVPTGMPLFTTLLNYRHSDDSLASFNWKGMRILSSEERTNYPITLSVNDMGKGFSLTAQCVEGIDPVRIVAYLKTAIEGLVKALIEEPMQLVETLSILPTKERQQLLFEFNDTEKDYSSAYLIHQLFENQVEKTPDAIAVVFENQSLSYDDLNQCANQVAHHLLALGIRPDNRVAICMERSLDMIVGLLGILKAGGAYIPLDPNYPVERLTYMIGDCAPVALLTQLALQNSFPTENIPKVVLDIDGDAGNSAIARRPKGNPDPAALGLTTRHLAYIIYTSGSTGQPKGVMIEHSNTLNFITWAKANFPYKQLSHTLFSTSINFDLAVYEVFVPLSSGATVHLVEDLLALNDSLDCITHINTVPSVMNALISTRELPHSVQSINLAGEPLKQALVETVFASTHVQTIANLYGPTETTTYSTWVTIAKSQAFPSHIGRPIANTQIYILDSQLQLVPPGVSGEIYIGGAGIARGYLNRPELTAERFIPDPFNINAKDHARLYRTGDLGRWLANGNIEYLGRNDFQVKIRGFRIELGEIEAQLALCQGVREAIVIAREDNPNEKRLVAYLLTQDNIELSAAELRNQLAIVLADYMIPSVFVCLPAFPLMPNGKLDRKRLPQPDIGRMSAKHYVAPRTATEDILAGIWADVLGVEKVGIEDNFFELGGHSLLATQLVSRICIRFRIDLQLKTLFETTNVAQLAAKVDLLAWAKDQGEAVPNSAEIELEDIEL